NSCSYLADQLCRDPGPFRSDPGLCSFYPVFLLSPVSLSDLVSCRLGHGPSTHLFCLCSWNGFAYCLADLDSWNDPSCFLASLGFWNDLSCFLASLGFW